MSLPAEILEPLASMPHEFEQVFRLVPAQHRRWQPENWHGIPGEMFCVADQACHIRDIEIDGYQVRIRRVLEEDCPNLVSLDSYALARERDYARLDPMEAITGFRAARASTIGLLKTINAEQLKRRARFGEYGDITLRGLVHFLCSHDQQHLACMQWLLGKIGSQA